ncbi:hypothetical protein [Mycolicibacter heraklionensis]|uniref:putative alpha/beta hydrolase n=1 Tax=Mycolicibacter heraklionensis TaxID=512402 RepID=UPI0007EFC992|nr:hypothetical protein [Mycolicibacter heraklionensis]OBJ29982.1 hypothetical protein A5631_16345 [Mycolicibacter heraklionensis]
MQLRYISLPLLIDAAGGDPWQANNTLRSGNPAAVDELAQAFHNAGACTAASSAAFAQARQRFQAAWNRENGEHPINDSREVQRATDTLHLQQTQLTAIGTDLEMIAAALAEAQKSAAAKINALEIQLQDIDNRIGMYREAHLDTAELEQVAIDDTAGILHQIEKLRDDYAGILQVSTTKLLSHGYDRAPLGGPLSPAPSAPGDQSAFEELLRANDQAVLDAMARVRAAQKALDDATAKAYQQGAGSDAAQEAMTRLPALKKNLADALDDLGKIPDYSTIDPASVHLGPDGAVSFAYTLEGQKMVVTGTLKNGSGEIYDQGAGAGSGAYFSYQDGKLAASRFLDPGRVTPDDALLQNVIFTAVGAGPAVTAGKAGVEAGWQGMRSLLAREALETSGGSAAGLSADNVLPRAITQAEIRAQAAADDLAIHHPGAHSPVTTSGDHIPPAATAEHSPAPIHEHPLPDAGPHVPHPLPSEPMTSWPAFTLESPLDHMSPELRVLSEQHLTGSGETVLGPFRPISGPSYIDVARAHGASYFDIGQEAWNAATETERLAANQHVLDAAIANRDRITLSVPFRMIRQDSYTGAEIRYLESHGYVRSGNTLIPPGLGSG